MKGIQRWVIVLVVLVVFGGLLEVSLRALIPAMIESGARLALRVPQSQTVAVHTEGSMVVNALRWRIADVTVTAEGVPLADDVTATTTLEIGAMPLLPAFGRVRDGTASFEIPADQLDGMVRIVSRGLADWGEMRDDQLVAGGVLTDQQFDLPHSPTFEIPYEGAVRFDVEGGDIVVTPSNVSVQTEGPVGEFLTGAMMEARSVCLADRLPAGVTLTEIELRPSGAVVMQARLSEGLLSNPQERFRGVCE